jgi:tetratricopeptide (TPR) repeat protein
VLASVYASQKNRIKFKQTYDRILRLTKKITQNPELLEGLVINKIAEKWRLDLEYGKLLLAEKKKKEAIKFLFRAVNGAPDKSMVYRLTSIACREHERFELAEQFLQSAMDAGLDPHAVTLEKALAHKAMGHVPMYRELLEDLLSSEDLNNPGLMFSLALEALKLGSYQKAELLLKRVLADSHENPKAFNALALICKYQGKIDEAVYWAEKTLKIAEWDVDALTTLGHLYYDQKKWDQAKACYQKGFTRDQQRVDVLFRLSLLSLMDQDLNECVELCDRLLVNFGVSCDMALGNIGDLALVYQMIGDAFLKAGEKKLHAEAIQFARAMQS